MSVACCSSIQAANCSHPTNSVDGEPACASTSPGGSTGALFIPVTRRSPSSTIAANVVSCSRAYCRAWSSRRFSTATASRAKLIFAPRAGVRFGAALRRTVFGAVFLAITLLFGQLRLAHQRRGPRKRGAARHTSGNAAGGFAFCPTRPYFRGVKVALVILHADPRKGGAEGYTVNLAHALFRRGHDVSLLATTFGPQCEGLTQVPLDGRGVTRLGRYRSFLDSLEAHLAATPYDVVHSIAPVRRCDFYHPQAGLAAEALASGHLKHDGLRRPLDRLATRLNRKRQFVAGVERQLLTGADAPTLLCVSDMVRRTGREHYASLPEEKLVTLFNAVDPDRFDPEARPQAGQDVRRQFGIGDDKVVALIVAQDFKRKGLRPAIEAVAQARDDRLVLLVVGKPDPRPYKQLAERLGVSRRVVFAGPTADTYGFYLAGDFFVLPTYHDPCSLVVLEALGMGLPTITTVQNGACEVIEEGSHGYVLNDPSDAPGIARAMQRLLDDDARRAARTACLALRPRLSYQRHLDQLEGLYANVRRGGSARETARFSG